MRKMLVLLLLCLIAAGCMAAVYPEKSAQGEPIKLMIIADLHHLAPELYDDGELFERVIELGDGKVIQYTTEILEGLVAEIQRIQPDGVILAGDLTFNGERESHLEVASMMKKACGTGIKIYALPGNHDVNYPWTYTYYGDDKVQEIKSITSSEFQSIYSGCGVAGALSLDSSSCGFVFPLEEDVWLMALDANTRDNPGRFSKETADWAENYLKQAREQGIHVITFSHHTLLDHNAVINEDYTVKDAGRMTKMLTDLGAHVNLSAHLHIQHIAEENGFYDIATGALSVYPHLYGLLEIDENRNLTYTASPLPLPENLLAESKALFERTTERRIEFALGDLGLDGVTYSEMSRWARGLNEEYYRGEPVDPARADDPAIRLWKDAASETLMGRYLLSIFEEPAMSHRYLHLERR